jgi:hypothetical protein
MPLLRSNTPRIYVRGHISVLDRKAQAKRTCECYQVVKKEYEPLLS